MGKRLFVSIDFSPQLCEAVSEIQTAFEQLPGLTLTNPEQAHITLKFLGSVDANSIDDVQDMLRTAVLESGVQPFPIRIAGLGVFPEYDYISVIWLGVRTGATEVARLHESIESAAIEYGFEPESFEFTPHVTIARMSHGEAKTEVQRLLRTMDPTVGTMTVQEVCLTESTLTDDSPIYETLYSVPLDSTTGP